MSRHMRGIVTVPPYRQPLHVHNLQPMTPFWWYRESEAFLAFFRSGKEVKPERRLYFVAMCRDLYSGFGPSVTWTRSSGRRCLAKAALTCSAVNAR